MKIDWLPDFRKKFSIFLKYLFYILNEIKIEIIKRLCTLSLMHFNSQSSSVINSTFFFIKYLLYFKIYPLFFKSSNQIKYLQHEDLIIIDFIIASSAILMFIIKYII